MSNDKLLDELRRLGGVCIALDDTMVRVTFVPYRSPDSQIENQKRFSPYPQLPNFNEMEALLGECLRQICELISLKAVS